MSLIEKIARWVSTTSNHPSGRDAGELRTKWQSNTCHTSIQTLPKKENISEELNDGLFLALICSKLSSNT